MSQNFAQVVEAVKELSLAEKEELQALLRKYAIEERRQELLADLEASLQEWREGKLTFSDDIETLKQDLSHDLDFV